MMTISIDRPPAPLYACQWEATWTAAAEGREPAESLPTGLRAALFRTLIADGFTIEEVGAWTRTTVYTVCRVLGNPSTTAAVYTTQPAPTPLITTCHHSSK
jgi:hypothetical protein